MILLTLARASVVNREGVVCAVTYSGPESTDGWPVSRVISAQKANTGNALSLDHFALSSANVYGLTQPGGSLYGLQASNPVDPSVAYAGDGDDYGEPCSSSRRRSQDGMCGGKIGGINVFGGGFGLYNEDVEVVGGLGVSGDSSCADHNIGWKLRRALCLDYAPNSVH